MWSNITRPTLDEPQPRQLWLEYMNILLHEEQGGSCFRVVDDPQRFLLEQALHKKGLDAVLTVAEVIKQVAITMEAGGAISDPDPSWAVVHSMQEKGIIHKSWNEEELF